MDVEAYFRETYSIQMSTATQMAEFYKMYLRSWA